MSHGADCSRCGRENDCWTSIHCYTCQGAMLKKMQQDEDDKRIAALSKLKVSDADLAYYAKFGGVSDIPDIARELIAARQVIEAARRHQQDPAALDDAIRNYDEVTK